MQTCYRIKNWASYQHYRERRPPWVKLHRTLLEDMEFARLDAEHARILVWLWLIASEHDGGELPDCDTLAWRVRVDAGRMRSAIAALRHWVEPLEHDASGVLADCKHDASGMLASRAPAHSRETETETEAETEAETEDLLGAQSGLRASGSPRKRPKSASDVPEHIRAIRCLHAGGEGEVVETIPLRASDGVFEVRQSLVEHFDRLYPRLDIPQTLREIKGWCVANPAKAKTRSGAMAFMTRWLDKAQNGR